MASSWGGSRFRGESTLSASGWFRRFRLDTEFAVYALSRGGPERKWLTEVATPTSSPLALLLWPARPTS